MTCDQPSAASGRCQVKCNLCTGIAHEDEGYLWDGEPVCCGCYQEELFYHQQEMMSADESDELPQGVE